MFERLSTLVTVLLKNIPIITGAWRLEAWAERAAKIQVHKPFPELSCNGETTSTQVSQLQVNKPDQMTYVFDIVSVSNHVYRELVVRLEMVAESQGTDFKKVDSGPLRYLHVIY